MEILKVNKDRVSLIKRKYARTLEKELSVKLHFDEEAIEIEGDSDKIYFALPILKAVSRGFGLDTALKLKNSENILEIINLRDFCNTDNCISRLKARLIGTEGKIKIAIEQSTDSNISIYGHTVAIIAPIYSISAVKEAINLVIHGAKHSSLLNHLSRIKNELFISKLKGK